MWLKRWLLKLLTYAGKEIVAFGTLLLSKHWMRNCRNFMKCILNVWEINSLNTFFFPERSQLNTTFTAKTAVSITVWTYESWKSCHASVWGLKGLLAHRICTRAVFYTLVFHSLIKASLPEDEFLSLLIFDIHDHHFAASDPLCKLNRNSIPPALVMEILEKHTHTHTH